MLKQEKSVLDNAYQKFLFEKYLRDNEKYLRDKELQDTEGDIYIGGENANIQEQRGTGQLPSGSCDTERQD